MPGRFSLSQLEDRVLVYDPEAVRIHIKKISDVTVDSHEYWIVPLGDDSEEWNIYADENWEIMWAQDPDEWPRDGHFVARINLQALGMTGRYFRRHGKLRSVYVLKR
ncbi:hypothetical protein F4781DRAFT_430563 [Annulohypoxylon bovei var. microspora]|nr:hypothetical protein F4781DRAFT_430563 [Annulohypoxylon bovei var. microspora]